MLLSELVDRVGGSVADAAGGPGPEVLDAQLDSRRVGRGDLFAALPGSADDGLRHVTDAVGRGAVVVLTAPDRDLEPLLRDRPELQVAHWTHEDPREALAAAAGLLHGEPASGLGFAGITGTNGKTTTAHLLGQLLGGAGLAPAVLGTNGHLLADGKLRPSTHTTPDAPELARLFRQHVDAGGRSVVMEVSSHALEQGRTAGLDFDVAVFTNLTREHLDYHGDMESYARAKARLFSGLRPGAAAVINLDDPASETMRAAANSAGAEVYTYSTQRQASLRADRLRTEPTGSRFELDGMGIFSTEVLLPLCGRYNVENALAAVAAACLMGASPDALVTGLATTSPAPGRFEPVNTGARGFGAFVDYAHSPDALERVLQEVRPHVRDGGRLLVVFGCGGDRDRGKRSEMGRLAGDLADIAVVTSDNPRTEDPDRIIEDVREGMTSACAEVLVEGDRRAAIQRAVERALPGDVLLVAGKGHETTQEIAGERHPFDDRLVIRECLS